MDAFFIILVVIGIIIFVCVQIAKSLDAPSKSRVAKLDPPKPHPRSEINSLTTNRQPQRIEPGKNRQAASPVKPKSRSEIKMPVVTRTIGDKTYRVQGGVQLSGQPKAGFKRIYSPKDVCPHGVPMVYTCAICEPERFHDETGIN